MNRRPLRSDTARAIANLAIDLGDPRRMSRARRLHRTGAVSETMVDPGRITSFVFGSRDEPYEVHVELTDSAFDAATVPDADDVLITCTCPDWSDACKHGLAVLLGFAEGVEGKPHLLSSWTGEPTATQSPSSTGSSPAEFFVGDWVPDRDIQSIAPDDVLDYQLLVDGTDAAPDFIDAVAAIRQGLKNRV